MHSTYQRHGVDGLATLGRYYWTRGRTLLAGEGRRCPLCGWSGRDFRPMMLLDDRYVRASVVCPGCGSWERQRAFGPALESFLAGIPPERAPDVLHVSPEEALATIVRPRARRYTGSNYVDPRPGQLQLDLHDLALPDESLDMVVMCYVLCCVPDDLRARESLRRVLRPGGVVVACEPFTTTGATIETPSAAHGGEWRRYGTNDIAARFAPFVVEHASLVEQLTPAERRRRGVDDGERMIVLRKAD